MRVQLTMSKDYRPSWGVWEGVREIAQNFLDAADAGYSGHVIHDRGVLSFTNLKADLELAQMCLLGEGDKAENAEARGEHADGLKVGMLALVRSGHKVTVKIFDKLWTATIARSRQYKRDVLTLESRSCRPLDGVQVRIHGISEELWEEYKRLLR